MDGNWSVDRHELATYEPACRRSRLGTLKSVCVQVVCTMSQTTAQRAVTVAALLLLSFYALAARSELGAVSLDGLIQGKEDIVRRLAVRATELYNDRTAAVKNCEPSTHWCTGVLPETFYAPKRSPKTTSDAQRVKATRWW